MSPEDNHRLAHMTPMAGNICTRAVFTTSSFDFGLQTYFGSHYTLLSQKGITCCVLYRALYAVFFFFSFKVGPSCFKWCGKWHVNGHTYVGVYRVDTMFLIC